MHWKRKALVQGLIGRLPERVSSAVYYPLQRRFGRLGSVNPTSGLKAGIGTWDRIEESGRDPRGLRFFEIGTGRMVNVPLAYWLMGAASTVTVDLNRYLKLELVRDAVDYVCEHEVEIAELFGSRIMPERLAELQRFSEQDYSLDEVLSLLHTEYRSPCDAGQTGLDDDSFDFHTSYAVLEHIPPESISQILNEAARITKPGGLILHRIDYSDHFSHTDPSITAINFLQFDDDEWGRLAGNRFMYMNRLRHSDMVALFGECETRVLSTETFPDLQLTQLVEDGGIPLHDAFLAHAPEDLATISAWIAAEPS